MAATWHVTPTAEFAAAFETQERTLLQALDQARTASARLKAREQLEKFNEFQHIYIQLLSGKADPAKFLHLAGQKSEGDYYALTEHGWQVLFFVDYERRTCVAMSLHRAGAIQRALSHRQPGLP